MYHDSAMIWNTFTIPIIKDYPSWLRNDRWLTFSIDPSIFSSRDVIHTHARNSRIEVIMLQVRHQIAKIGHLLVRTIIWMNRACVGHQSAKTHAGCAERYITLVILEGQI